MSRQQRRQAQREAANTAPALTAPRPLPDPVRIPVPPGAGDMEAWQHGEVRVLMTPEEDHGDEGRWRHVSVSCHSRLPTYEELGQVRERYFDPQATVLQIMPPASAWVNEHRFCLHLWQRLDRAILPEGLHRTVGVTGSVPHDDPEVALIRQGHTLAAILRNQLRARGSLSVPDAARHLRHLYRGPAPQLERDLQSTLEALADVDPDIHRPLFIGAPYRWRPL